jgi:hypothetical protein
MKCRRSNSRRRGGVTVFTAVALPALLCATALVLDGGMLMSRQRQTQAVADAAAHAAACTLYKNYAADAGLDPAGKAKAAALGIAASNDYNDKANAKVVVNIPPASGTFAGKSGNAEVVVTFYQPRYFSAIFPSGTIPVNADGTISVTARSVGRVVTSTPPSILLTDPSSAGSLTLTGGARLTANGAIQVNSSNAGAVNASNGAYAADNGGLNIVGGYSIPGWATTSTFFSKAPTTGNSIAADPYATLPAPSTDGLSARSAPNPPYGSATIYPGIYNGGLTLGGGMTITMSPGIYYIKGNFTVANGVTLTGTSGVMIYMDSGAISLQGGCTVRLTAPSSGTYSGIVYYQNRNNTSSLNNIANGAYVTMSGALYAPNAPLTIAGGAYGASYGSQFVVKSLNLSNGVNITIDTSLTSGSTSAPFLGE